MINDVNDVNATPTAEVFRSVRGLNVPNGTIQEQIVVVEDPLKSDQIAFNTTYYWWVKVYTTDNGNPAWTAGDAFTTPGHAYPYPDFVVSPSSPKINATTTFMQDNLETGTTCYLTGGQEVLCQNVGAANYEWDFDYNSGIDSNFKGNATKNYNATGTYEVMLKITDNAGACYTTKSFEVKEKGATSNFGLPRWREVAP